MTHAKREVRTRRLGRLLVQLFAVALLVGGMMHSRPAQARLHPYYVLTGQSFGQVTPRILFVLDTSGSMGAQANEHYYICDWSECEDASDDKQSRISAARKAIRQVVVKHKDQANFALMTFDTMRPPNSGGQVPSKCKYGKNDYRRFYPIFSYSGFWLWNQDTSYWGTWMLCGDNRPYPYLRWDNLGRKPKPGVAVKQATGPVPSSPLRSVDYVDFLDWSNSTRKVQWFPAYMGTRINLNPTTDPTQDIVKNTWGDYGSKTSDKMSQVWGHDFYYWPYVDGFPGYSAFDYYDSTTGYQLLGYQTEDNSNNSGALVAPFYLDAAVKNFKHGEQGPLSRDEAEEKVLQFTDHITRGGVDVGGGTPWSSAVGPIIASPPQNNAIFSHGTVASYLKFAQNIDPSDVCAPQVAILLTDGNPSPGEGGWKLHKRLSALRNDLNTKVYVIGFTLSSTSLNNMACAAAGSNNDTAPCAGSPTKSWDTCKDPTDPGKKCAYLASNPQELADVIGTIVEGELQLDVPSGPGSAVNDFGDIGSGDIYQSNVSARTDWPAWQGHVERSSCTTMIEDPPGSGNMVLAPECAPQTITTPEATFGPCPQGTAWDAGDCLQQTDWRDRRIYVNDANNNIYPIFDKVTNKATPQFRAQLNDPANAVPGAPFTTTQADAIARFIQGEGWKDGWKLPGLANSAPIVVRRIPAPNPDYNPQVAIRDPHCAGRKLSVAIDVDPSLVAFAEEANDPSLRLNAPSEHWEYQEAVVVGDDLGLLHAFQYDSGNELFAFLPRFLIKSAVRSYGYGGEEMGQPDDLDDHVYGVAATLNAAWVHDPALNGGSGGWRHLAVVGMGEGGTEYMALDLSHMSPVSPDGPFEVLWTTADSALAPSYDKWLGETWARPALTYNVPDDDLSALPEAYLVMGSGYAQNTSKMNAGQGRQLMRVDALTGNIVERAALPLPTTPVYEPSFAAVTDPAVGTYCESRFWGEMQETYITDPAGRLYRWDLGYDDGSGKFEHEHDSGGTWGTSAQPVYTFRACQSKNEFSCTVSSSGAADVFVYPPAVVAQGRIDDDPGTGPMAEGEKRRFLVAMVSGSPYDDSIDGGDENNDFHSSIYLLADDHSSDDHGGFDIANGGGITPAGTESQFFRLALSDIPRTRTYTPFPTSPTYTETRVFSKKARPIRAPQINVSQLVDDGGTPGDPSDDVVYDDSELYTVTFTVYEPGDGECSNDWYDPVNEEYIFDAGSTYEITLQVEGSKGVPFDFTNTGANSGYGVPEGLTLTGVEQVTDGECADGVCGPKLATKANRPCDPNTNSTPFENILSVPMSTAEVDGFNAREQ